MRRLREGVPYMTKFNAVIYSTWMWKANRRLRILSMRLITEQLADILITVAILI